jgi:hypothetical protein
MVLSSDTTSERVIVSNNRSINIENAIFESKIGFEEDELYQRKVAKKMSFWYLFFMTISFQQGVAFLQKEKFWDMCFLSR